MALAIVRSRALAAAAAPAVTVEVHLANGLPAFSIVGLPDLEVRESRERVRAALQNCCFEFPARRITVNLAPADLPKESGRFDLPIALGILAASGQIPQASLWGREFAGELSLSGDLCPIRGAFAMACGTAFAHTDGTHNHAADTAPATAQLYLPLASAAEAALVPGVDVYGARDLPALCAHLRELPDARLTRLLPPCCAPDPTPAADLADVIGQAAARRALEVAAAGAHHLLMVGPPGAGKSMLAARLAGILPPMTIDEALASAAVLSTSPGGFEPSSWRRRPFRAPHHSASAVALVGGGNPPRAGEITLAHEGVLFLDELPEFDRRALEMLREPLETRQIAISRAARQAQFPAGCQLIAAMNPCPCGWFGEPRGRCRCTPDAVARYRRKLSGPLLDRIDIHIDVAALAPHELAERRALPAERSATVALRVAAARQRQMERQQHPNAQLDARDMSTSCQLDDRGAMLMKQALDRYGWSARAHFRVLKVARTIADLEAAASIDATHLAEAVQYRQAF